MPTRFVRWPETSHPLPIYAVGAVAMLTVLNLLGRPGGQMDPKPPDPGQVPGVAGHRGRGLSFSMPTLPVAALRRAGCRALHA